MGDCRGSISQEISREMPQFDQDISLLSFFIFQFWA
jgi:hypothetical protein